jgi:hypothetical protein
MFNYFRLDKDLHATSSPCENSVISRREEENTKKKTKRRKAFWEIRGSLLKREATAYYCCIRQQADKLQLWTNGSNVAFSGSDK